jgi:hypothetical protein
MVMPDKSRYVYLYLPSAEDKARWDSLAKEAIVSADVASLIE